MALIEKIKEKFASVIITFSDIKGGGSNHFLQSRMVCVSEIKWGFGEIVVRLEDAISSPRLKSPIKFSLETRLKT